MGFYLHVDVESPLSASQFQELVLTPLGDELEREGLGRILDLDPEENLESPGRFVFALEVTDQTRARATLERFLKNSKFCKY